MTKVNQETIVAIAGELSKIGTSFAVIGEHVKNLGLVFPSIEEVLPSIAPVTVAKTVVEDSVEEDTVVGNIIETEDGEVNLDEMSIPQLKKFAKEYEIEVPTKGKDKIIEAILEAVNGDEEEEEEEVEEVEDDVEETVEEETTEEEEVEDEDEEGVDIEELSKDELISFIEENDLGKAPKKKAKEKISDYEARLREFIYDSLDLDEVEEAVEEELAEDAEDTEEEEEELSTVVETDDGDVDLAELNLKELKAFAKDYGLEVTAKKKDALIEEILEQLYADDEESEDGEPEEVEEDEEEEALTDEYGLNDMDVEDLAELLEENGLSTKGKKQALVDRILRAIEDGTIELEDEEEGE